MAQIPGSNVSAGVRPNDTQDRYDTHDAQYGRGGWHTGHVDVAARNAIPVERRDWWMVVPTNDGKKWELVPGLVDTDLSNNANWREWVGSGVSGTPAERSAFRGEFVPNINTAAKQNDVFTYQGVLWQVREDFVANAAPQSSRWWLRLSYDDSALLAQLNSQGTELAKKLDATRLGYARVTDTPTYRDTVHELAALPGERVVQHATATLTQEATLTGGNLTVKTLTVNAPLNVNRAGVSGTFEGNNAIHFYDNTANSALSGVLRTTSAMVLHDGATVILRGFSEQLSRGIQWVTGNGHLVIYDDCDSGFTQDVGHLLPIDLDRIGPGITWEFHHADGRSTGGGENTDLSNYYTKTESDNRYAPKGSGTSWVPIASNEVIAESQGIVGLSLREAIIWLANNRSGGTTTPPPESFEIIDVVVGGGETFTISNVIVG